MRLPDLGVGFVCLPGLEGLCRGVAHALDAIEVEAQTFWVHDPSGAADGESGLRVDRAGLAGVAAIGPPALVHSVGYPVGGARDGDARHRRALRETFDLLKPAWWSEHASFLAAAGDDGPRQIGFLMPPLQGKESVGTIADRIRRLQDDFGLPFAFETGVSYLRPLPGELSDGDFWGAIADRADCGILLDVHNVWANQLNGRQSLAELAARLPLERVWEMHVAGGQWHKNYWLDSHSGLPADAVLRATADLVPNLPSLHAITLEIMADQVEAQGISEDELETCFCALRTIWDTRGAASRPRARIAGTAAGPGGTELPAMRQWELMLAAALGPEAKVAGAPFSDDPGLHVYRDLIAAARRGTVADALPLSMRYLYRSLGGDALRELFPAFWREKGPEPFMSDEALNFAAFARARLSLPHLGELLEFELAAHRAAMSGEAQTVFFTCDPEPLLDTLRSGEPLRLDPACVEVEVTPPARARAAS
jgi:uncharacterized protein (UPF0276 family)